MRYLNIDLEGMVYHIETNGIPERTLPQVIKWLRNFHISASYDIYFIDYGGAVIGEFLSDGSVDISQVNNIEHITGAYCIDSGDANHYIHEIGDIFFTSNPQGEEMVIE